MGGAGNSIYKGIAQDEYLSELTFPSSIDLYDEMRRSDPRVRMTLRAVKLPVQQATWTVKAAEQDEQGEEIAKFVEAVLLRGGTQTWTYTLRHALWMLDFGFACFEKVWELRDRPPELTDTGAPEKVVWLRKLAPRHPRSIERFCMKSGAPGITQRYRDDTGMKNPEIPLEKLVFFVNEKEGDSWEGISLLRSAYKPWLIKSQLERVDAAGHERTAMGVPRFRVDPEGRLSEKARDELMDQVETIAANLQAGEKAWIIDTRDVEFQGFEVPDRDNKGLLDSVEFHSRQVDANALALFLSLGSTESGSRAVAEEQRGPFDLQLEAVASEVAETLNKYVVRELVEANFGERPGYPELVAEGVTDTDLTPLLTLVVNLVEAGLVTISDEDERWIREQLKMPQLPDGARVRPEPTEELPKEPEPSPKPPKPKEMARASEGCRCHEGASPGSFWRERRPAEWHVAYEQIELDLEQAKADFLERVGAVADQMATGLAELLADAVASRDLDRLKTIKAPKVGKLASRMKGELKPLSDYGRQTVREERDRALAGEPTPAARERREGFRGYAEELDLSTDEGLAAYQAAKAEQMAENVAGALEGTGLAEAFRLIKEEAARGVALEAIEAALKKTAGRQVLYAQGLLTSEAFGMGRGLEIQAQVEAGNVDYGEYSALLDSNVCEVCAPLDGRRFPVASAEFHEYLDGNGNCLGGSRCRCMLFLHWIDQSEPTDSGSV